ncbi:hypothetical protein C2845_PM09G06220 [Panicum miliaceum]|uniref:Uncharacterized protein n=1 Tax=Panicum miliaceum TaxID=4540 RepID=A0A3L6S161_PANMI|nr:hypothetical protein C2845_PM09G06220 [Panicum miliaceum]
MGEGSSSRADGDEEVAVSSSYGLTGAVWFRQMLHRWQSASSTGGGDGGDHGAVPNASIDQQRSNDAASAAGPTDRDEDRNPDRAAERRRLLPRVVVVEERERGQGRARGADAAECGCGGSPVTPATTPGAPADVPRGWCPVYVSAERRRFVVPTAYLAAPAFRRLLEKAEEEFGFHYHGGALTIPCDTEAFKYILVVTSRHRQGLADDTAEEGTPRKEEDEDGESDARRLDEAMTLPP